MNNFLTALPHAEQFYEPDAAAESDQSQNIMRED